MKTLRLILWRDCLKCCAECVNRLLPPQPECDDDFAVYDEIVLTGGEPLMYPDELFRVIERIRKQTQAPIYVYTALVDIETILYLLKRVEGITLTIHDKEDFFDVPELTRHILETGLAKKSLRLNSFVDIPISDEITRVWDWDIREYDEDCQIPENEVVREYL